MTTEESAAALAALGRRSEAIDLYRTALAGEPRHVAWHCNLMALLHAEGRHADCIHHGNLALDIDPHCAAALYNQALSLLATGAADAAAERLAHCAALNPHDPKILNNLGLALAADARLPAAIAAYDQALRLHPGYARALNNRAAARMALRQFEQAIADLDRALELDPHYTRALLNRGAALRAIGRYEDAFASYRSACPDPEGLANATDLLMRELGRGADALPYAQELHRRFPERDDAAGAYHGVSQGLAQWGDYEERVQTILRGTAAGRRPASPFRFLYVTDAPEAQLHCARAAAATLPAQAPLWRGQRYDHERIRIAYLSSDFHAHATAYLTAGLFERHDRRRFECFALAHGRATAEDAMRSRLRNAFEHFEDVAELTGQALAEHIRSLEIDVLVDMKGYTSGSRLEVLSHRPAPLQVHFLGYPGTLGTSFVDYLIADRCVAPLNEAMHYSERLVHMPHTYQVTDDRRMVDAAPWSRERAGLPAKGIVLAGFHQPYKLNPRVFDSWMRLLGNLPDTVLWLLVKDPLTQARLATEARARGVDPRRLIFAQELPQAAHLARLGAADLMLDTWPYGAHTTASDALWAGLPIVALSGRSFASRVSGSILQAAALPELVTGSVSGYESVIMELCSAPERLRTLRSRVQREVRHSPLFDTAAYARALEHAYQQMYDRHAAGLPPAHLSVEGM